MSHLSNYSVWAIVQYEAVEVFQPKMDRRQFWQFSCHYWDGKLTIKLNVVKHWFERTNPVSLPELTIFEILEYWKLYAKGLNRLRSWGTLSMSLSHLAHWFSFCCFFLPYIALVKPGTLSLKPTFFQTWNRPDLLILCW